MLGVLLHCRMGNSCSTKAQGKPGIWKNVIPNLLASTKRDTGSSVWLFSSSLGTAASFYFESDRRYRSFVPVE